MMFGIVSARKNLADEIQVPAVRSQNARYGEHSAQMTINCMSNEHHAESDRYEIPEHLRKPKSIVQ